MTYKSKDSIFNFSYMHMIKPSHSHTNSPLNKNVLIGNFLHLIKSIISQYSLKSGSSMRSISV